VLSAPRPMSIKQPNAPKSSAGNKRKRNNVPKGWETEDELLDDEFTTIREASAPVAKVAEGSPDQLDSAEFGASLLGSQKITYSRSSQSSSQQMTNIHTKTGSQKPLEKKSKDSKIGQSDLGQGIGAIIDLWQLSRTLERITCLQRVCHYLLHSRIYAKYSIRNTANSSIHPTKKSRRHSSQRNIAGS